ncbi:ribosomal protein S21 [Kwoniella newhampshirensis]|uniref:Ribosomal protein S21 n=1 Tax=Kwoniella newhampshirensis TaxID=1651941 RepID=A0AAW0Z1B6_9TREE
MLMLFRSALRASTTSTVASTSRVVLAAPSFVPSSLRYNSTLPPSPPTSSSLFPSSSSTPTSTSNSSGKESALSSLRFEIPPASSSSSSGNGSQSSLSSSDPNAESWWIEASARNSLGYPMTTYSGRSILVPRGGEFISAYKRLGGLLRNSNMKKELRLGEFYEKPSVRRRRLLSERHRRRFKEMVRTKVQQVISMRSRG